MDFWDYLEICFWIVVGIAIINALLNKKKSGSSGSGNSGTYPQTVKTPCPYCGHECWATYTPGRDRYPAKFRCGECYRKFGDFSRMTESEKQEVRQSDAECVRVERMPDLGAIFDAADRFFAYKKKDFICIKDGEVYAYYVGRSGATEKNVLFRYSGPYSKISDQHICFLYLQHLKKKDPPGMYTYVLMDNGVSKERTW